MNLTPLQHIKAMQGDEQVMRDLVTAGLQGTTKPGFYRILRRVYNETMDSRTVTGSTDSYLLKDVLYTQYFHGDGSAIHYNWWPPRADSATPARRAAWECDWTARSFSGSGPRSAPRSSSTPNVQAWPVTNADLAQRG